MFKRYRNQMLSVAAGLMLAGATQTAHAEQRAEGRQAERLGRAAVSAADHLEAARQYDLRAKSFEAKADEIERALRRRGTGPHNPMATKWPALVTNAREREERLAMQHRRAAQECYARAERHRDLADGRDAE